MLLLVSALLVVPGVFGIAGMLRTRGRRLGLGASILALLGGAGHVALAAFYVAFTTIPSSDEPRARAIALIDHIVDSGEVKLLAPLAIAFPLAILLTLLATVRSRLVGRRLLLLLVAAPIAAIVTPGPDAIKTSCALALFLLAATKLLQATTLAAARPNTV
jgi:Sec-independent protein secretion pathway component TatC